MLKKMLVMLACVAVHAVQAVPVDLAYSHQEFHLEGNNALELYGFEENTTYVVKIAGECQLLTTPEALIVRKNCLLIENANCDEVVSLDIEADGFLTIDAVSFRTDQYPNLGDSWNNFIDHSQESTIVDEVSRILSECSLSKPLKTIFTIGCEAGKDPLFWANLGADVTILDGTPHAVAITALRMAEQGFLTNLKGIYACCLEDIPDEVGTFDAVTGSGVFPFIPPELFEDTMSQKVLTHVAPGGYFAGHFFGPDHGWADQKDMTFVTAEELEVLFIDNGFEIVYINDSFHFEETVYNGWQPWHEIKVIARRK